MEPRQARLACYAALTAVIGTVLINCFDVWFGFFLLGAAFGLAARAID